jgi:hypothetical protein
VRPVAAWLLTGATATKATRLTRKVKQARDFSPLVAVFFTRAL